MRSAVPVLAVTVLVASAMSSSLYAQTPPGPGCARLAEQKLANTTIRSVEQVTTGSFTPPGTTNAIANLPPFCRVAGTIAPTPDSQILFEVWLPLEGWNGKFSGVGNGGWAGVISYPQLADQLRRGYAAASTNTGHAAAGGLDAARFAFEKPEQLLDFAYRSHHEMALPREGDCRGVLRETSRALLFHRLLLRRLRRSDGRSALPSRLRRHRRRHAGEQLDAADGRRFRRNPGGVQRWREQPAARRR